MGSLCGALFGQSQTTTYSPPAAVTGAVTDILNRASTQSNQPYPQYTPDTAAQYMNYVPGLVAPMTPNQVYAGQSISGLQGYTDPNFAAASAMASNAATPIQMQQYTPEAVNQYMNPYMNDVVNSAVANINQTNAQQQQEVLGNTIQRGAFGGDRAGIAQAELARQQDLANNATVANLLNQGYTQAQGLFTQQQGQDLTTQLQNRNLLNTGAINLANLGTQGQQAALQQAQAQYGYGTGEQQQQQAALSTAYQQYMNQQAFPYQQLSYYAGLASGAAPAMGGSTTGYTPTVAPASGVLGAYSTLNSLSNAATGGSGGFLSGVASGVGSLFAKGGRINYDAGGRAKYATDGRVPTNQSIVQAYNDYVDLISSGRANPAQINAAYKKYIQAFENAPAPYDTATTTTTNTTTTPTVKTDTTPVADVSNISHAGDKIGGGNDSSVSPIYGENGNIVGRGSLSGPGASGGPTDEYGINPRAGDTPGFGTPGAGGGYGINQQKGILSGLIGGVDQTTGAQTGIAGAINALVKGNSPGSLNAVLNAPNNVAYGTRDDGSAYPNTSTGMTAQEWANKFADGDISKVSGSVVNGQIDWFRNDNAVANAVHPGALPASQLSGVIDNVRQPEQTDTSGITDPLAGGADLGATKSAGILGNPYKGMTKEEFIAAISPMAEQVAQQTGLTPQTIMAQTAEETGWGQHMVGNNLFNIKGTDIPNVTTTENIPGEGNVKTLASFAGYENPQKAFDAYGKLMSGDPRYAGVIGASDTNAQINALGQSGYATDSAYGRKVQSVADAIAKMNIAPPEAKEDYSINTPKGVISSDSSSEPSSGIGAASEGHGGNDQTQDTSGVGAASEGHGGNDQSGESDHVAGVKEESQAEHNEKRGGRIHKYAAGGYAPISMQYGLPTQDELAQTYSDFAGTGVGQLSAQQLAMAAKGVLPSAKGGRIHAQTGVGISEDNDGIAGNANLIPGYNDNSEEMWTPNPEDSSSDDIFQRLSKALKTPINQADLDRAYEVGKTIHSRMGEGAENAAERKKAELAAAPTSATGTYTEPYEPGSASGTYTASYDKTQPVTPKVAPKQVAEDQEDQSQEQPKSKNVQVAQATATETQPSKGYDLSKLDLSSTDTEVPAPAPTTRKKGVEVAQDTTRTQSDAPQPGFGYVAPNPADMRNFYGLNYGLSLLSGSSIASAGDTYAKNILAQQEQQRAQMEAQGRTAQSYGAAQHSQALAKLTDTQRANASFQGTIAGTKAFGLDANGNPIYTLMRPLRVGETMTADGQIIGGDGSVTDTGTALQHINSMPISGQETSDKKATELNRYSASNMAGADAATVAAYNGEYRKQFENAQERANAAGYDKKNINETAVVLGDMAKGGLFSAGKGAGAVYNTASVIQSIAQRAGLDLGVGQDASLPEILEKIRTLKAESYTGAQRTAAVWLTRLADANPSVDLRPETSNAILTQYMLDNQRSIDFANHMEDVGAINPTAINGAVSFNKMYADTYRQEQQAINTLLNSTMPNGSNPIAAAIKGDLKKKDFDIIINQMQRQGMIPSVKNIDRYIWGQ